MIYQSIHVKPDTIPQWNFVKPKSGSVKWRFLIEGSVHFFIFYKCFILMNAKIETRFDNFCQNNEISKEETLRTS